MSSRGKKRKVAPEATTPVVPEKLLQEIGSSSPADDSAEHARQVAIVMKVTINSTHLKGTYIRDLKNVAAFFSAAWKDKVRKTIREGRTREERNQEKERTDDELAMLKRENEALRKQLAEERAERLRGFPSQKGQETRARDHRLDALEKKMDTIGPQVAREVLSQVRGMLGYEPNAPRMKG